LLDEAAHIDPNLFYKTIVPILQLKNTSLLALSSPEGNENYYSQLLNLKDGYGRPWFKIVNKQLVCPECQKGDQAKQLACDHVKKDEHWLSNAKLDRLKALYAHAEGTALQELSGMVVSDYKPCFNADDIKRCFDHTPRVLTQSPPGIIYIGADPSGGGPSHLAVCSGYFTPAWHFVVRM
jgi:hypothetical protein